MNTRARCSVIVPVPRRSSRLEAVLEALTTQSVGSSSEMILVGSAPPALVLAWRERMPDVVLCDGRSVPGVTALNAAAEAARSDVLLFLGEEVVPEPDLVAAHLSHHAPGEARVVLGDVTYPHGGSASLCQTMTWLSQEDMLHKRSAPGRRSTYRDFRSENVSLPRDVFLGSGGFDVGLDSARADDDLGYRLVRAGVRFVAEPGARAYRRMPVTIDDALRRERIAGGDDVRLGLKHPDLRRGLRLLLSDRPRSRWPIRLAFESPDAGDTLAAIGRRLLPLYARGKMRLRWLRTFRLLGEYAYWRGAHDMLGSWAALDEFRRGAPPLPVSELDVTAGVPENLPEIWVHGPSILTVTARGRHMGDVRLGGPVDTPIREHVTRAIIRQLGSRLRLELDTLTETAAAAPAGAAEGVERSP